MKKLLFYATVLLGIIATTTSCNKKSDAPMEYTMLATIVDGSWATGNFSAKFDNGEKAFVENSSDWTIKGSSYLGGETRAVITFYYVEGATKENFDHVINITGLYQVPTEYLQSMQFSGISNPSEYDAGINIDQAFVANNFLNIALRYIYGDSNAKHDIKLVLNNDRENSVYKELYNDADDDYLYLELYHDSNNDTKKLECAIYYCYKLEYTNISPDFDLKNYKGIKILYKSLKDNNKPMSFSVKL